MYLSGSMGSFDGKRRLQSGQVRLKIGLQTGPLPDGSFGSQRMDIVSSRLKGHLTTHRDVCRNADNQFLQT